MNWKDFFYFSKRERRGIFFLVVLITGIFLGKWLFTPKELPPIEKLEISDKQEIISYKQKTYSASSADPYRPNSPSPTRSPEKHTYYHKEEIPKPTVYSKTEKLSSGETVELNSCDTAQLMKIPSIGSSFAKRIVSYRNLLGGYTRVDQLQEVYGMYEELYSKIAPYITVDPAQIQPIPVNSASLDRLKAHPYLNFYQAKAMIEIRKKKGKIATCNELILLEEFNEQDWERILPYLEF